MIKQYYARYDQMEDYQNGMYGDLQESINKHLIGMAADILSNDELFYSIAKEMIKEWPLASKVQLTNKEQNRRSWIGQATCCFHCGISNNLTSVAWFSLTDEERDSANKIAERIIYEFEESLCQKLF